MSNRRLDINHLIIKAASWGSPHVRNLVPVIGVLYQAAVQHNIDIQIVGRHVEFDFDGQHYIGMYKHPSVPTRQRARIVIYRGSIRQRTEVAKFTAGDFDKAVTFKKNPRRTLRAA
jgi:hypothetical protein